MVLREFKTGSSCIINVFIFDSDGGPPLLQTWIVNGCTIRHKLAILGLQSVPVSSLGAVNLTESLLLDLKHKRNTGRFADRAKHK